VGYTEHVISIQSRGKGIKPKIYEGRVWWACHFVCCADGIIYDPMLGEPKPLEEYTQAFYEEVSIRRELS